MGRTNDSDADDALMGEALAEAAAAAAEGEVPVGAVAVRDGAIVARARNRREANGDPLGHAELLLLRAAAGGDWRLEDVTVYVTLEPCVMCAGAMVQARIARLVYGAADPKGGACGTLYDIPRDPRLNHRIEVRAGVRADECGALLTAFFRERRSAK